VLRHLRFAGGCSIGCCGISFFFASSLKRKFAIHCSFAKANTLALENIYQFALAQFPPIYFVLFHLRAAEKKSENNP